MKTAVVFSPIYYQHNPGRGHPESPRRLQAIVRELERMKLSSGGEWRFVNAEKVREEDLELVHSKEYVKLVKAVCRSGGGLLDLQDTVTSPESFKVALYAVGGTLKAVNLVMSRKFENAFALVRPPGHHAGKSRGLGFCLFNNISVAAQYLLEKYGIGRVLVLDVDAHHGNGTQEIFYETDKVLYISLHEDPSDFPGTGFIDEVGEQEGLGYSVNVPLPYGTGDQVYLKAVDEIMVPIARLYRPQFILVSAGFDGHYADPVGNLALSAVSYRQLYETIVRLASEICQGRLVAVLEGGYDPSSVGKLAATAIAEMSGAFYTQRNRKASVRKSIEKEGSRVIDEVKRVQRAFWSIQ